jgi:hypothetical protein
MTPEARQVAGADKILCSRVLMARSSNDVFSGVGTPGLVDLATW